MKYFLYISFIIISFTSLGQDVKVESILDNDHIKIGEQAHLRLNLSYSANSTYDSINWPEFDNYITNDIEIIFKDKIDSSITVCHDSLCPGFRSQVLTITSFEVGKQLIPSIKYTVNDSDYFSNPIPLWVETVEIDTTQGIFDVYDIYDVDYPLTERAADFTKQYWHWFLIGVLLVLIYILYRKYKNRPQPEIIAPKIIIPAHVKALKILNQSKDKRSWENDNRKAYYSELTDAVRLYLEDRFNMQALEQTTSEIIRDLQSADITTEDKLFLKQILQQADFVKFAKFNPTNEDGLKALDKSFDFVEKTKIELIDQSKNTENVE